jgi:ribonuclease HIII
MSLTDNNKCARCKRDLIAHTDLASCEACPNVGPCDIFGTMLLCASCIKKEMETAISVSKQEQSNGTAYERNTIDSIDAIAKAMAIDSSIRWSGDFYNAATVSIAELKQLIEADETIAASNKHLRLTEIIQERTKQFKQALFDTKRMEEQLASSIIAHQQYLNQLVSKLREDERAKFKEHDINFKPPDVTKKPSAPRIRLSVNEKQIKRFAAMMKISEEKAEVILKEKGIL